MEKYNRYINATSGSIIVLLLYVIFISLLPPSIITPILFSIPIPIAFILMWLMYKFTTQLRNVNFKFEDFFFINTYNAKQKLKQHISSPSPAFITESIKFLKEIDQLNEKIKRSQSILSLIAKDEAERLLNITQKIKDQIIPYIHKEKNIDSIISILDKFAQFFKDTKQVYLLKEIENDIKALPTHIIKDVTAENILSRFISSYSEKLLVRFISWLALLSIVIPIIMVSLIYLCINIFSISPEYFKSQISSLVMGLLALIIMATIGICGLKK